MTGILPLIGSIFRAIPIPIGMIIVLALFLFLGTWLIVRDLRKKTKMITLTTVMVLLVSIVSISKFIPERQSMKTWQDKTSTTIENKDKAPENRYTALSDFNTKIEQYKNTTPTRTPEEIIASIEKVGKYPGFTQKEIDELTAKISEKSRQAALSEGQTLKVIEKIVIVYKLEMIQAGDTPREKQAVMEKINNMIDSEINAVEKQIEKERKLAEEGRKTKEILVSEQLANAIKNQGDIPKLTYGEQREIIHRQIQKETDRLKELKERMAASEKHNKELLEKIATAQAKAKALVESTAKDIVKLERQ